MVNKQHATDQTELTELDIQRLRWSTAYHRRRLGITPGPPIRDLDRLTARSAIACYCVDVMESGRG